VSTVGGDQPLQLTRDERNGCPVWSPDGYFIAFTRRVGDSYSIHVIASDGGASKKRNAEASVETRSASFLITSSASPDQEISTGDIPLTHGELDWSPDGKFIAFAGPDGIYLVSRTDFTVHRLTQAPKSTQDWGPAFAPDGKKVLFVRDNQLDFSNELRSVSIGGGNWTRIFSERGKITSPPQWSYDGGSVIFSSNRTGHPALWRISLDSPTEAIQVSEAGAPAWDPAVSRRGYRLAYERLLRSLSIWQMDLTASDKAPYLAVSSTSDTDQGPGPQFSPDGQKLAYMSDRSGTMEIWIANRDGSNAFLLTAVGGAGRPRWSPDSKAIVFDVGSTTGEKIVLMNLAGWRTADIGGRRLPQLFARRQMGLLCCQPHGRLASLEGPVCWRHAHPGHATWRTRCARITRRKVHLLCEERTGGARSLACPGPWWCRGSCSFGSSRLMGKLAGYRQRNPVRWSVAWTSSRTKFL